MNKKCLGCGAFLNSSSPSLEGFVQADKLDNVDICERCFRIKNYGDYKTIIKDNNVFIDVLKEINKTDSLVVLVVDLFNMPENFDLIKNTINNPILLVLTKRDILPKSIYDRRLLEYMDNFNLNYLDKVIVSSNKNYNFDLLLGLIRKYKTNKEVYIIGYTNAGKSTLINKLIYNYSDKDISITTSLLPSTTIDTIEIKLEDDLILIDTPGLLEENSIDNYIGVDVLKKITPKNMIKPVTYQIKNKQWIVVEDLLKIECSNNNITLFMANNLKIDRYFNDKENGLKEYEVDVYPNSDLVISGLGSIKFMKKEKIKISIVEGAKFYIRKWLI